MAINTSMYSQPIMPDIVGGVQRAQNFKSMMAERDRKAQQRQSVQDAFSSSMVEAPDGSMMVDQNMALSKLAKADPETFMKFQGTMSRQKMAEANQQLAQEQARGNQAYRQASLGQGQQRLQQQATQAQRTAEFREKQLAQGMDVAKLKFQEKQQEKHDKLFVPGVGIAATKEDAKDLKSAVEMKAKFDSQIGEMIALRKEYGTEYWNREAVGRGKQLSKDLLLTYKNLAKLGVLSKADEDIINAIIPADPLGHDFAPGTQDPILHQLQKFQADSDAQYAQKLKTRLKPGTGIQGAAPQGAGQGAQPQQQPQQRQAAAGPHGPSVVQNGKIYRWNPTTGNYE